MPFIDQEYRNLLEPWIAKLVSQIEDIACGPESAKRWGLLNYVINRLLVECTEDRYSELQAAIGCLEAAKLELYRRKVAPYEDKKLEENGDIKWKR